MDYGETAAQPPQPMDRDILQQQKQSATAHGSSKTAYGAPKSLARDVATLFDGIAAPRNRALSELRATSHQSERQVIQFKYIMEEFLPRLYSLLEQYSTRDIVNSKDALSKIDNFLIPNRMQGWTEQYLRMMADPRSVNDDSDSYIVQKVADVNDYLDKGQNAPAIAEAKRAIKQIENGKVKAAKADYDLLSRVANS